MRGHKARYVDDEDEEKEEDDNENDDVFEPGYKPKLKRRRPAQTLSRCNWLFVAPTLCLLTLLPYILALCLPLHIVALGETDSAVFSFHRIQSKSGGNIDAATRTFQQSFQPSLFIIIGTIICTIISFIFSELYVINKHSTPMEYDENEKRTLVERLWNYQVFKGYAIMLWSLAFMGAVLMFGVVSGPTDFLSADPIAIVMVNDLASTHGHMLLLMEASMGLVCLDIMWYVWRIQGNASTYVCWQRGGCLDCRLPVKSATEYGGKRRCCDCKTGGPPRLDDDDAKKQESTNAWPRKRHNQTSSRAGPYSDEVDSYWLEEGIFVNNSNPVR